MIWVKICTRRKANSKQSQYTSIIIEIKRQKFSRKGGTDHARGLSSYFFLIPNTQEGKFFPRINRIASENLISNRFLPHTS